METWSRLICQMKILKIYKPQAIFCLTIACLPAMSSINGLCISNTFWKMFILLKDLNRFYWKLWITWLSIYISARGILFIPNSLMAKIEVWVWWRRAQVEMTISKIIMIMIEISLLKSAIRLRTTKLWVQNVHLRWLLCHRLYADWAMSRRTMIPFFLLSRKNATWLHFYVCFKFLETPEVEATFQLPTCFL